jgi:hypothetical protein
MVAINPSIPVILDIQLPIVIPASDLPEAKPTDSLLDADECHKRALWYLAVERAKRKEASQQAFKERLEEAQRRLEQIKLDKEADKLRLAMYGTRGALGTKWENLAEETKENYRRVARLAREIHGADNA